MVDHAQGKKGPWASYPVPGEGAQSLVRGVLKGEKGLYKVRQHSSNQNTEREKEGGERGGKGPPFGM